MIKCKILFKTIDSYNYFVQFGSSLEIYNVSILENKQLVENFNYSFRSVHLGHEDTSLSGVFTLKETLYGIKAELGIYLKESEDDINYQRQFFKTIMDIGKFLKGSRGNSITSVIVESILINSGLELKIPMLKGDYAVRKAKYPTSFFVLKTSFFLFKGRVIVKTKSKKPWIEIANYNLYGKVFV